ncbi:MAG: hypothetical protein HFE76_05770 [Firmicutes bacterium]|nr:hypothetical protein [Bacillota bacterium]
MTALRQAAIAELKRVPEDKLDVIIQFINSLMGEGDAEKKEWNLEQFIMPPTERGQNADAYIRELRDDDRF